MSFQVSSYIRKNKRISLDFEPEESNFLNSNIKKANIDLLTR